MYGSSILREMFLFLYKLRAPTVTPLKQSKLKSSHHKITATLQSKMIQVHPKCNQSKHSSVFLTLTAAFIFSISFLLFYSRKYLDNECLITEQGRLSNGIKTCKSSNELFSLSLLGIALRTLANNLSSEFSATSH